MTKQEFEQKIKKTINLFPHLKQLTFKTTALEFANLERERHGGLYNYFNNNDLSDIENTMRFNVNGVDITIIKE